MKTITIVTPTYNRGEKLKNAYKSLTNQTVYDFEWLVIDDGSNDNTENIVKTFKKQSLFNIKYIKQENGGKHTALNKAFQITNTELFVILDSDDCLTENAIEEIIKIHRKYLENEKIAAYVFQRGKMNEKNKKITQEFKNDEFIDNYNTYIINNGVKGDKAEAFRTSILKKYKFPEFKGEKFLGEGVLWSKISHDYDMVFCNKVIYLCEYLENGLTKSGRKLRMKNPNGGKYHAEEYLDKRYKFKVRLKNAILFLIYSKVLQENFIKILKNRKEKMLLLVAKIPSEIIYYIWK